MESKVISYSRDEINIMVEKEVRYKAAFKRCLKTIDFDVGIGYKNFTLVSGTYRQICPEGQSLASRVMLNCDPQDRFVYQYLTCFLGADA